jgi:hypothetical protein
VLPFEGALLDACECHQDRDPDAAGEEACEVRVERHLVRIVDRQRALQTWLYGFRTLLPSAPCMRVRLEVDVPAAAVAHVRVQLRRREVGVPEHLLDAAQVRAPLEQVGRERVAQEMRMHALGVEACLRREAPQDQECARAREAAALRVQEQLRSAAAVEVRPSADGKNTSPKTSAAAEP